MTVKRYGSVLFDTGLIEMACGDYVTYSDYQKLVAENAALKAFRPQPNGAAMMEALDAFFANEEYPEGAMSDAFEILCCKRVSTPATDAAIAEIKAQGADTVAEYHRVRADALYDVDIKGMHRHQVASLAASDVAANLRAGRK